MTRESGLGAVEVRARLERDGPNRLPAPPRNTWLPAVLSVSGQPMVLLLLGCTLRYAFLGNTLDAAVLGASIVGVAAIAVYQELRAQRVLDTATGERTALGRIGRVVVSIESRPSRLHRPGAPDRAAAPDLRPPGATSTLDSF